MFWAQDLSYLFGPSQAGGENGTADEPSPSPQGLQEPEAEDIKTVPAGDTIYASATSFEDLRLSEDLLKAGVPCLSDSPYNHAACHQNDSTSAK